MNCFGTNFDPSHALQSCSVRVRWNSRCQCVNLCGGRLARVVWLWWGMSLCAFCTIGIVCGLPVGFWWLAKISWRIGLIEEQDGAPPCFRSIEYIKCTLPALAAPAVDVIE